ncbi:MAG TPA: 50S ribosomal protein L19e [Candidatus Nanoarchaeia archaeon]|nr:50S ribosomal protein L19e [Candidatus Nanoarchaeia archaeon]
MDLKVQKRIAASVLDVSPKRIWFDTNRLDEIKESITKTDIRSLIRDKAIQKKQKRGISGFRSKKIKIQKSKGRRKGEGSKKGTKGARLNPKQEWMIKVRLQRAFLRELKNKKMLTTQDYRSLFKKVKGGFFRSKRHIKLYLDEQGLINKNGKKE